MPIRISKNRVSLENIPLNLAKTTVASATTPDIWTGGNVIDYTGTTTATGFAAAPQAGASRTLVLAAAASFTAGANMLIDGVASGSTWTGAAGDRVEVLAITTTQFRLGQKKADGTAVAGVVLRGYIDGCILSTAGSSATMSVTAGQATDDGGANSISLSAISKTTSAWAVGTGNGGLDTGTIANNTWYHFFAIKRTDTGVVDVLISTSATAPTMPANYTLKRRIGSGKTTGSAQWVKFTQVGDRFDWLDPVIDVDATNPGTAAVSRTLSVPTGVNVVARISVAHFHGSTAQISSYVSPLHATDTAPQVNTTAALGAPGTLFMTNTGAAAWLGDGVQDILTNTSAQIRSRMSVSGAGDHLGITTYGWIDSRGRDA